jgi:hypothetical protein
MNVEKATKLEKKWINIGKWSAAVTNTGAKGIKASALICAGLIALTVGAAIITDCCQGKANNYRKFITKNRN